MTLLKEIVWKQNETYDNRKVVFDICYLLLIITLTIMVNILGIIKGPTIKIQGRSLDLYDVVKQVEAAELPLK